MELGFTLIGQMITFGIFVWFTMKFIWPMLENIMEERKKKITDGLMAAEKGHASLKSAKEQAKLDIKQGRERYNNIVLEAKKQAQQIIEEAKITAKREKDGIIASGELQIQQALNLAKTNLQKQLANLVIKGASKILSRSIQDTDHKNLLDKLSKEMSI